MTKLSDFLNNKFFDFQRDKGRRVSISDFAQSLDVSQPSLSQWMRGIGREPNLENLVKLSKLGAKETFEAAGFGELYHQMLANAFGDPRFQLVAAAWFDGTLNEQDRAHLLAVARGEDDCKDRATKGEGAEGAVA